VTAEELLGAAERDELHARVLEERLDQLDPRGGPYRRRSLEIELPDPSRYSGDDLGNARFRADLAAARRAYLKARYREHSAAAARRERYAEAAARGIDRFAGEGSRSLDELLEPTRERIRATGGLSREHLTELGR
jgi:hypothetical protein